MTGNWRKSSRSGANGACVEARLNRGMPQVRDSKLGDGSPIFELNRADLTALLNTVR